MIRFEHTNVMNFENAIRGMRNPLESWDKSDSYYNDDGDYVIGENDIALAQKLAAAGSDHRKFLRQIFVSVDITAPLYWWKEYDTYKVGTAANSTSTMHKIHAKPFSRADFSCERMSETALNCLDAVIETIEVARIRYTQTHDVQYWDDMIQLLPSSYNQTRTCTMNYENLMNMYRARHEHKLPEWREFCAWAAELAYFQTICMGE